MRVRQRLSPTHSKAWHCAGRVEFTEYFPENTQGILVQPVGDEGVLVAATDTQRGFGSLDQVRPVCALPLCTEHLPLRLYMECTACSLTIILGPMNWTLLQAHGECELCRPGLGA